MLERCQIIAVENSPIIPTIARMIVDSEGTNIVRIGIELVGISEAGLICLKDSNSTESDDK